MTKQTKRTSKSKKDDFPDFANGEEFDALSDAEKEKVFNYYDTHRKLTELRPLDKAERTMLRTEQAADRKKIGRPIVGEGSRQIAVTIEAGLLRQVDEYAKSHGIKRAQLIALGLRKIIGGQQKFPTDKPGRRKSA